MSILYVVADRQGAGKTALCASLAHLLRAQGRRVVAYKPVADGASDSDAAIYAALLGADTPQPSAADAIDEIAAAARRLSDANEIVIAEASNNLTAAQSQRIAEALDARVLVMASFDPALSAADVAAVAAPFGDRLAGYAVNNLTQYMRTQAQAELVPAIAAAHTPPAAVFGLIPEDRRMLGVSVSQLAAHLEGEFADGGEFTQDEGDAECLVEYLMVGGMSLDPGEYYYGIHDNRAAIVRGDRPDLQMSALSAPGRTACLVATNGIAPIEYVRYEAEQEETPIIIVETDTLDTMDRLDTLIDGSRFDHPRKLERFAALLTEHLDLPRLIAAITD